MKSKFMNILFIDDEKRKVVPFMDALNTLGHTVCYRENPESGIASASHLYNLIFVDFKFGLMSDKNGSDIGMELRKKCPLVPLVLLTNFGKESIREFIYVGFDDYFEKHVEGERVTDKKKRLVNCLEVAITNSQKRIKSIFSEDELSRAKIRLDAIEYAYTQTRHHSDASIAMQVYKYEIEKGIIYKHPKLSGPALVSYFRLYDSGIINPNALKAKQLLIENSISWQTVRKKFRPILDLINEFSL